KNYYLYIGGILKTLVTTDPSLVQHVMQRHHRNYEKSHLQTDIVGKFIGRGLLTNTGTDWLRQRRLIQPGFHRNRLEALTSIMQNVINQELDKLSIHLKQSSAAIDIYELNLKIAFNIVAKAIYSEDIDDLELEAFSEMLTSIQEYAIKEVRLPFLSWYFNWSGQRKHHLQMARQAQDLQRQLIAKRRASGIQRDDLMQMLLDSRYEDTEEGMTDQQLIDEAAILFVAGHETSANTLSWTLYLLAQHPDVLKKVKAELNTVCPGRAPTFAELRQLTYLTQVINESMRLYPPAWITDRVPLEDDQVNGITIPKGTMVSVFIYGLHHQKESWNEPEVFRPERFNNENRKNRPPFSFMPFGGGPRLCIGNNFAMMEIQLVLAAVLRRFKIRINTDYPISVKPLITLRPANGIRMYLHENESIT
ncbi:MAG: cytochrome P450, partial [Bacteroidota bacterium]